MDVRQKNLKLTDKSIELLRFLAYDEEATESEVVEQALVKYIAIKTADKIHTANYRPIDGDDGEFVTEARYMAQRLQRHDPLRHWRVVKNSVGFWELQSANADERTRDEMPESEWAPWPWVGATNPVDDIESDDFDDE